MHIALHDGAYGPDELLLHETDCLVVGLSSGDAAESALVMTIDRASGGLLKRLREAGDLPGKSGATLMLHQVPGLSARRLLLVGLGTGHKCDAANFLKAARAAAKALSDSKSVEVLWTLAGDDLTSCPGTVSLQLSVRALRETCYRFDHYRQAIATATPTVKRVSLTTGKPASAEELRSVAHAVAIANGVALARDLGNAPPNICTPTYLAKAALALGKQWPLTVEVLDRAELKQLGMQAFLSVARGSIEPLKLIVIRHAGGVTEQAPIVLIGKGVTFDAGGISIKPAAAMDEMKFDMCGAAAVLGTLRACAEMALPLNVIGVIPACENMPSGNAVKPGDIVKSMSGKHIEVLNTDAEGRLILCDALTYTERFEPAAVIDVATLTGACVVALGHINSGLFSNQDSLAEGLSSAARRACDPAWRMPLEEAYQERLDSNFADMANIGSGGGAGSVVAACFLSRFAKYPWAHLDIAGTAWKSGATKGATGRPVPLLAQFLIDQAAQPTAFRDRNESGVSSTHHQ
ncbi:MAG TPA: leucyl aminopeptidase [Rhodanobacter sp.]|jgi:leucyl aminopeptidase|nr:leucyl aminopeptidase [Rhodanobacter sp.]